MARRMQMPDEDCVPAGPHRRLLEAVHELRDLAGRPSSRRISEWINADGDLPGTMSHAQVAGFLSGQRLATGLPVRALATALAKRANPSRDPADEARRIEELWRAADDERATRQAARQPAQDGDHPETTHAAQRTPTASRTATADSSPAAVDDDAAPMLSELGRHPDSSSQRDGPPTAIAAAIGQRGWTSEQALNVLDQAVRTTAGITDPPLKALALAGMAQALAKASPERARDIADQAARTAAEITDMWRREELLAQIAGAVGEADPDLALRIAADIKQPAWRGRALAWIAQARATNNPERARDIAAQAQHATSEIIDVTGNPELLADLARALATVDPNLARRAAWSMSVKNDRIAFLRAQALAEIVSAFTTSRPDQAGNLLQQTEDLVARIAEPQWKARALAEMARALATTNPERSRDIADQAERTASEVPHAVVQAELKAQIAVALATVDFDEAERVASNITDETWKARALAVLARTLATADPERARDIANHADHIAANITNVTFRTLTMAEIDETLDDIARALSTVDPDRALRIAGSIPSALDRAPALAALAADWLGQETQRHPDKGARPAHTATVC